MTDDTYERLDTKTKRGAHFRVSRNVTQNSMALEAMMVCLLADIRDELHELNGVLNCKRFLSIPTELQTIRENTTRRKYTRKATP